MTIPSMTVSLPLPRRAAVAGGIALGVLVLAASAHVKVPFWPVPMTLQPLVIALLGLTLGMRQAGATVAATFALGMAGAPVFAGGVGPAVFVGPTGGYLVGFLAAALVVGWLRDHGATGGVVKATAAAIAGMACIHVLGLAWLSAAYLPLPEAVAAGTLPFLAGDLVKAVTAGALATALGALRGRNAR